MNTLDLLGVQLRRLVGRPDEPLPAIRPGAPIEIDTLPLVLSDDVTHLENPVAGGAWLTQIEAVGRVSGDFDSIRIHLDAKRFIETTTDETGVVTGRLFEEIDRVYPETAEDWEAWIGDDGLIGYSAFQLREDFGGEVFQRHWRPGREQSDLVTLAETLEALAGARPYDRAPAPVEHQCMLFRRALAQIPGGPNCEFLLVSFLTLGDGEGADRSIRIHAGIDLDARGISLP